MNLLCKISIDYRYKILFFFVLVKLIPNSLLYTIYDIPKIKMTRRNRQEHANTPKLAIQRGGIYFLYLIQE